MHNCKFRFADGVPNRQPLQTYQFRLPSACGCLVGTPSANYNLLLCMNVILTGTLSFLSFWHPNKIFSHPNTIQAMFFYLFYIESYIYILRLLILLIQNRCTNITSGTLSFFFVRKCNLHIDITVICVYLIFYFFCISIPVKHILYLTGKYLFCR